MGLLYKGDAKRILDPLRGELQYMFLPENDPMTDYARTAYLLISEQSHSQSHLPNSDI